MRSIIGGPNRPVGQARDLAVAGDLNLNQLQLLGCTKVRSTAKSSLHNSTRSNPCRSCDGCYRQIIARRAPKMLGVSFINGHAARSISPAGWLRFPKAKPAAPGIPARGSKIPVSGRKKFPHALQGSQRKSLWQRENSPGETPSKPPTSAKFPINFPYTGIRGAQTGSHWTASSASQSGLSYRFPYCLETSDTSGV
jgi:hypothetical protein